MLAGLTVVQCHTVMQPGPEEVGSQSDAKAFLRDVLKDEREDFVKLKRTTPQTAA